MNLERWQRIQSLYHDAVERKAGERSAFLDNACGGDQGLRKEVESLLAQEREAENFIESPAHAVAAGWLATAETALLAGQAFGPYHLLSLIGKGGMGAVYKATDSRLNRVVAIKILLQDLSGRTDLRERFRREAQAIANLNHPNICVLHDIGTQDGRDYLVMEYLEGATLAQRLEKGALPPDEIVKWTIQITDALDKIHRQGVVHRDLKPGNVILTRSGAKLLDFGLAKLMSNPAARLSSARDSDITAEGMILGTLPYMAPEQVQGNEVDVRSDIFSLGALIYEMLAGHKAFDGKNPASVIASVLEREPEPIPTRPDQKLKRLEYVMRKCIAKDPQERWQNAHDLLLELRWIDEEGDSTFSTAPPPTSVRAMFLVGILAVILGAALGFVWLRPPAPERQDFRFAISAPADQTFASPGNVSPDGQTVAFLAKDEKGEKVIWVRSLDSLDPKPLRGTEEAVPPFFWSPDSKQIGFFTNTHLKRIALPEGPAQTLAEVRLVASGASGGGAWNSDGTILFTPGPGQSLFQIPAAGGASSPATALNQSEGEVAHVWPSFLPDQKHFIYVARSRNPEKTALYAGRLGSSEHKRILDENTLATYAAPGYLLFVRGQTLLAQKFDTERLALSGNPIRLDSGLEGIGWYSVSQNGVLTVQSSPYPSKVQLIWYNRKGEQITLLGAPDVFYTPVVSPDGRDIAVERLVQGVGLNIWLWLFEGQRDRLVRFTLGSQDEKSVWSPDGRFMGGPEDQVPVWSRDGRFIAFTTESPLEGWIIRRKPTEGTEGAEDLLTLKSESYTTDWSPDGHYIAYESFDQQTQWDSWLLPVMDDRKPQVLLKTLFNERQVQFSPDGRWIAYISNLSGHNEVYVQRFPISGEKWQQISSKGGGQPRWRRDGRELFYIAPDQKIMAVEIKTSPRFEAGPPVELFQARLPMSQGVDDARNHYDVSADGQRFLVNTVVGPRTGGPGEPASALINVRLNWTAALKQ